MGKILQVLGGAHFKWTDIKIIPSTSAETTVKALRNIFAIRGLLEVLVSDNGPAFTSEDFQTFLKGNGIHHVNTSPYHPVGNGLAERAVKVFKEALTRSMTGDIETKLAKFSFKY